MKSLAWIKADEEARAERVSCQSLAESLIALSAAAHLAHGVAIETGRNDVASELVVLAHKVASLLAQSMRKEQS